MFEETIKITLKYSNGIKFFTIQNIKYSRYQRDVAIANLFLNNKEFKNVSKIISIQCLSSTPIKE